MDRYLKSYLEEGYFLRIKDLVLLDYYIDKKNNLYLKLNNPEEVSGNNSSFFKDFDINIYEPFILKIRNQDINIQYSIIRAFEMYLSELSYSTILFNKNNFLEINEHNGVEMEEGWYSYFADFKYESVKFFTLYKEENNLFEPLKQYYYCSELINRLKDMNITIANTSDSEIVNLKFDRITRLLNLAVYEIVPETINFLKGYYLERPDIEYKRETDGEKFKNALIICEELINKLKTITN